MQDKQENIDNKMIEKKGFFRKAKKIIFSAALYLILFLVIISTAIILLVQTHGFRTFLANFALGILNEQLVAKIEFSDIKINPFAGIEITDFRILTRGDTFAFAKSVVIDYEFMPLLEKKIIIKKVELFEPDVRLLRSISDRKWNIAFIAKPSKDSTKSALPKINIEVLNLVLTNGKFSMIDSSAKPEQAGTINFMNMRLKNIYLNLRAGIDLSKPKFRADIKSLSAYEAVSGFILKKMKVLAIFDTTHVEVIDLSLSTPKSDINLNADIQKLNVFGNLKFEQSVFDVKIKGNRVYLPDIHSFTGFHPRLAGYAKLNAHIIGTLNDLSTKNMEIETENSFITLTGGIKNTFTPKNFIWYGDFGSTHINYKDLKIILPELNLSSIPDFQKAKLTNTYAIGYRDSIVAKLNIESGLGNASGNAVLSFVDGFSYRGNIAASKLDIGKIIKNESLNSNFNGSLKFNGKGTTLKSLAAQVEISANNSVMFGYSIHEAVLKCNVSDGGLIKLDSFGLALNSYYAGHEGPMQAQIQKIQFKGTLDLRDFKHPKYSLDSKFYDVNLAFLTQNPEMPYKIDGKLKIDGEGFKPDSLNCIMVADIDECSFPDKGLMPFSIKVDIRHEGENYRSLVINSELFDLSLKGEYNFNNILSLIKNQLAYLGEFFTSKANLLNTNLKPTTAVKAKREKIGEFPPINFRLKANVNDLSALNPFLKDMKMHMKANLDINFDVDSNDSHIRIDSLNVSTFELQKNGMLVNVKPITISGEMVMTLHDSLSYLKEFSLNAKSDFESDINGLIISNPSLSIDYKNETANFRISSLLNEMIDISTEGNMIFGDFKYDLTLSKTQLAVNRSFIWTTRKPISVSLDTFGLNIKELEMVRENAETVSISGRINSAKADNLKITIVNLPMNEINRAMPENQQNIIKSFKGKFDFINLTLNDSLSKPNIKLNFGTSPLQVNGIDVGGLFGNLQHLNSNISGEITLQSQKQKMLQLNITALPINLALASVNDRVSKDKPMDINLICKNLPITLAAPFITAVSNLKGFIDANLKFSGYLPQNFEYSGQAQIKNASFLLQPTNMNYFANGNVEFKTNSIQIKDFKLYNIAEDLADGSASINAQLNFDKFTLKDFDFQLNTKKLKILSAASARTLPTIYGDFIIASGPNPLRFTGSLQSPKISGDLNILRADLTLPQQNASSQLYTSTVKYEIKGNRMHVSVLPIDSVPSDSGKISAGGLTEKKENEQETSFSELLAYDLYVRILGRLIVTIDLSLLGQVYSEIGTQDNTQSLHIVKATKSSEISILGGAGLVLKEGSTLKYIKIFKTTGTISFPTGKIDNPGLDLSAEYNGQSYINDNPRKFRVLLKITGTKNRPNIKFDYYLNEDQAMGDSTVITQNALFLLATGKTKTELEGGGSGGKLNLNEIGASSTSALISKMATDLLQGTGVIQSADIDLSGGSVDKANLKLTGQLFGNVVWRVGGTVADFTSNNEISIDIPLGFVVHPELMNNIILQLTKSTSLVQSYSRNQKQWEVKLKFGGSW